MARATYGMAKAFKRKPTTPPRGVGNAAAKLLPTSKEELRARIEKLERANANLRVKNKEFRRLSEEMAERLDMMQADIDNQERKAGRALKRDAPVIDGVVSAKKPSRKTSEVLVQDDSSSDDHTIDGL